MSHKSERGVIWARMMSWAAECKDAFDWPVILVSMRGRYGPRERIVRYAEGLDLDDAIKVLERTLAELRAQRG